MNHKNRRQQYQMMAVLAYLFTVFYCIHMGYLLEHGHEKSVYLLAVSLDHLLSHPLQIFPTQPKMAASGFLIGFFPVLAIYSDYLRNKNLRPDEEVDSAKWNDNIKKFRKQYTAKPLHGTGSPNMILTKNIFLNMDSYATKRNNNVMVIGGSGTGKSRYLAKPNLLQANCSYVVTDPSGELLASVGKFLKDIGYDIKIFNLVDMEHSDLYNPFRYIREQADVPKMICALIMNTTPEGSHSTDPFWEKAETALLTALSFYVLSEIEDEEQNFATVKDLLSWAMEDENQKDETKPGNVKQNTTKKPSLLDSAFKVLEQREPDHIAVKYYKDFKSATAPETISSILLSCQIRLQAWNLDAIRRLTSSDTIDLRSVGDKKTAIFCIIPTADSTYNFLISLMYTQLFETLYHHAETECPEKHLPIPVRFLLDEFANIGMIPDFEKKLSTIRKYQISCTIIIQALSQIKARYKDSWEIIIGNCDSLLFLGGNDQTTLEYISKKLGKETIRSVNTSQTRGRQGSYTVSYNKTGRELMTASELGKMSNDKCIYMMRGEDPFYSTKYDLTKHPNYSKSGDADVRNEYHMG